MTDMPSPPLSIRSVPPTFWRCGVRFTQVAQTFPAGRFTPKEVMRLKAEVMLVVEEHSAPAPADPGVTQAGVAGGDPAASPLDGGGTDAPTAGVDGRAAREGTRQARQGQRQQSLPRAGALQRPGTHQ